MSMTWGTRYILISFKIFLNNIYLEVYTLTISLVFQLHDKLYEFVTDSERELLITKLQETEDWLYEDGEDETKGVYIAKLDELKKVCFLYKIFYIYIPVFNT